MAKQRSIGRYGGFNVHMEGLDELTAGLNLGAREIADVWRSILRGPFGEEFRDELLARMPARTGYTKSRVKVQDDGMEGVKIGIPETDLAQHPSSKRANAKSVGVWMESGTRMHLIPTKVAPYNVMSFGGRVVSRVAHPGTRAPRPMFRTLQLYRKDFASLFIRELDRRLAHRMNLK